MADEGFEQTLAEHQELLNDFVNLCAAVRVAGFEPVTAYVDGRRTITLVRAVPSPFSGEPGTSSAAGGSEGLSNL